MAKDGQCNVSFTMKVIIPVGGLGTRFLPLSKVLPKELFPIIDKPVIQYIVEEALLSGFDEIIFVISEEKKWILKYFEENESLRKLLKDRGREELIKELDSVPKISFKWCLQPEPLGDGDAILKAKQFMKEGEAFGVLFGDDILDGKVPALKQLYNAFQKVNSPILGIYKMPKKALCAYGVPGFENTKHKSLHKIINLVEKPKENPPSSFALIGKYILNYDIFTYLEKTPLRKGELILANALSLMLEEGKPIYGKEVKGKWLECGTKAAWLKSFQYFLKKKQAKK